MILRFFFIFFLFLNQILLSQVLQTVKGRVVDKETGIGLPGAIVQLKVIESNSIVVANNDGFYKFNNVPVGRQSFLFSFSSYKTIPINDIIITSGKELVINVELE